METCAVISTLALVLISLGVWAIQAVLTRSANQVIAGFQSIDAHLAKGKSEEV